jgi:hypothetical protein
MNYLYHIIADIITEILVSPFLLIGALIVMVLIGRIILVVIGAFIMLIPAFLVAGIVYWLTGSELLTGIALLFIALLAFARR